MAGPSRGEEAARIDRIQALRKPDELVLVLPPWAVALTLLGVVSPEESSVHGSLPGSGRRPPRLSDSGHEKRNATAITDPTADRFPEAAGWGVAGRHDPESPTSGSEGEQGRSRTNQEHAPAEKNRF